MLATQTIEKNGLTKQERAEIKFERYEMMVRYYLAENEGDMDLSMAYADYVAELETLLILDAMIENLVLN